jgi:hypothetical protein
MREMEKTDTSLVFRIGGYNSHHYRGLRHGTDPAEFEYKVLVEGDSWANILYPWSEFFGYNEAFPNFIERDPRFYYNNVGWPGDTLENIVERSLSPNPEDPDKGLYVPIRSGIFDFLIFSGGGNDFLGGGELKKFLKPYRAGVSDSWECLDKEKVDEVYSRVTSLYRKIIKLVNVSSPHTHIFVHGYDHAVPRSGGRWLGTPFSSMGYTPEAKICRDIIASLVDRMYDTLEAIASSNDRVHVVNVRGLCHNNWHDELHPNRPAAKAIADKFISTMVARHHTHRMLLADAGERDRLCIPTLIDLGSRKESIAKIHAKAADYMVGSGFTFPTRACAATLSAFLHASGIGIETELGAEALASILKKRGWDRIDVGHQQPGDVGVTISNKPPAGADHIYLVVQVHNSDRMTIADNQAPDPHERYASGRGKTRTEYFLRAPGSQLFNVEVANDVIDYSAFPYEDEDTNALS